MAEVGSPLTFTPVSGLQLHLPGLVALEPDDKGATDVLVKSELHARFGVPWYLIVDPEIDRVEVFRLAGRSYELLRVGQSPGELELTELGGGRIPLEKIFGP